ncbi:MAG: 4Fe-4S cluster-binding domain-containing protein [Rikenellaceae bacterium]
MLKFTDTKVVFQEIPDHITLAINMSGCPCACEGCHSSYLSEDIGEALTTELIDTLLTRYASASCISFMGGDREPAEVSRLALHIRCKAPNMAIAWYSGRDELSNEVKISNFDYIKIGSYQQERGPLNAPTTNQRLYKIDRSTLQFEDITKKML